MKIILIILGTISLILGIIGIFLPILPTTPFLLLTATLYSYSSPKLYNKLIKSKHLGSYIVQFRENKSLPLRTKVLSLLIMWSSLLYTTFFIIEMIIVRVILIIIAMGITIHILSFKTLKK